MKSRGARVVIAAVLAAIGTSVSAGDAAAITPTVTPFNLSPGSVPLAITAGPDGNLWFTDPAFTPAIGRFNPNSHAVNEFGKADGLQTNSVPRHIAAGPDGNLWFTDLGCAGTGACEIGMLEPATHTIVEFNSGLNAGASPEGIAAGPDGNLWFTDRGTPKAIGRINPDTDAISEFSTGLTSGSSPEDIAAGPDGNLWFAEAVLNKSAIGTINPSTQEITEFGQANGLNAESIPGSITEGPDGRMWFADRGAPPAIGVINPSTHAITEFSAGLNAGSQPRFIARGPEGDLWFTDNGTTKAIGRIDPTTGAIAEFSKGVDQALPGPVGITAGPDGNMWFADRGNPSSIARITTPPTAVTVSASATGARSATVSGRADGHAQATSFAIEFGPVGGSTKTTAGQSLGTTSGQTPFSGVLSGLKPNTEYRARVLVTNPTDTTAGAFLTFRTRKGPPNTKITKAKVNSKRHRGTFRFKAIGTASGFQCKLTRGHAHKGARKRARQRANRRAHRGPRFRKCKSPKTYEHLRAGSYVFSVRAIGPGGADPTPAKKKFKIKG